MGGLVGWLVGGLVTLIGSFCSTNKVVKALFFFTQNSRFSGYKSRDRYFRWDQIQYNSVGTYGNLFLIYR